MGGIPPVRHGLLILQISITAAYKSNFPCATQNKSTSIYVQISLCLFYKQQSKKDWVRKVASGHCVPPACTHHRSMHQQAQATFLTPGSYCLSSVALYVYKGSAAYMLKDISLSPEELRCFSSHMVRLLVWFSLLLKTPYIFFGGTMIFILAPEICRPDTEELVMSGAENTRTFYHHDSRSSSSLYHCHLRQHRDTFFRLLDKLPL